MRAILRSPDGQTTIQGWEFNDLVDRRRGHQGELAAQLGKLLDEGAKQAVRVAEQLQKLGLLP